MSHTEGPQPGDPRSSGPRPSATWRDGAWGLLAGSILALTLWQLARLVTTVARDPALVLGAAGLVLAIAITVVWLLTVSWLVLGAWRRTVWGCPFDHDLDAAQARRCPRHRLVHED